MATKKTPASKVFDVAKPGAAKPDIGSKPMIIGHKSMASDPMMREAEETAASEESEIKQKSASKIQIQPLTDGDESESVVESSSKKKESEKTADDKTDTTDTTDAGIVAKENADDNSTADSEPTIGNSDVSEEETGLVAEEEEEPEQLVEAKNQDVIEDTAPEETKVNTEPLSEQKDKAQSSVDKKTESIDPAAVELEREDNLKKLIESKKYRLNIKETKERSSKSTLGIFAFIVVATLIGLFVAIDMGKLDPGFTLPFSIFNSEKQVTAPNINPPAQTSASEKTPDAVTKEETSAVPVIPQGYSEYKNTVYGYSIWYPSTMEVRVDGLGAEGPITSEPFVFLGVISKETPCCGITIDAIIDAQGENKQKLSDLYKQGGVKAVADESYRINKDDKNPNLPNKTVSEVKKSRRGAVETYEFTVSEGFSTGFFDDTISGMVLEKPAVIVFFDTQGGVVRIQTEANNSEVDTILQTLSVASSVGGTPQPSAANSNE